LNKKGHLFVLSGSSGGGKTTIIRRILEKDSNFIFSVSSTTRTPRPEEIDGKDYNFLSHKEFHFRIESNKFLEWAEVHGELYGIERDILERDLADGKNIIFDIDVHGGEAIHKQYPDSILIFIYPPSLEELKRRLQERDTNTANQIEERLACYSFELERSKLYHHRVLNDNLDATVNAVFEIIDSVNQTENTSVNMIEEKGDYPEAVTDFNTASTINAPDGENNIYTDESQCDTKVQQPPPESEIRLSWLVDDFLGITDNIYEAVMVAARRARQVGRRQKQEIDSYNATVEATEIVNPEEDEAEEPGSDHFFHIKPTVKALRELKDEKIKYYYPEKDQK